MWDQAEQALLESVARLVTGFARLLPGTVALIVALGVAAFMAWIAGALLRRSLRALDFDAKAERWGWAGLAELAPQRSPTRLAVRLVRLGVMCLGIIVGVAALDATMTTGMVLPLLGYFPSLLAALVVTVVGAALARFLGRGVLIGAVNMNLPYARLLSAGVRWLVLVLTAAIVLKHLGIGAGLVDLAFGILFGGIVFALALAVGLGSRDLVSRTLKRREEEARDDAAHSLDHL
ncbi:MAG: hypothetical protein R6V57_13275 [Vicinamibacterales bacterium]